jgi:hypothetical protein
MDIGKRFGTNPAKETEGVWLFLPRDYHDDDGPPARVLLARAGNRNYQKMVARLSRPHRHELRSGAEGVLDSVITRAMSKTILLDWENITEYGKTIVYSQEEAFRLLSKHQGFREMIADMASDIENFRDEELEEGEKNL